MLFQRNKDKEEARLEESPASFEEETVKRWRDIAAMRNNQQTCFFEEQELQFDNPNNTSAPTWPNAEPVNPQPQTAMAHEDHENFQEGIRIKHIDEEETTMLDIQNTAQPEATTLSNPIESAPVETPSETPPCNLSLSAEDDLKRRFGSNIRSALGPGTVIEGTFRFDSPVCVDGTLSGEITSTSALIVGNEASINGTINVGTLIVFGTVNGSVEASELVEIRGGGLLEADINTKRIAIEDGGWFSGRVTMKE